MDASAYTGFHKTLAERIISLLSPDDTLCDIGCGLGRLDLELAPYVSEILAVDVNEYAAKMLKRDAERAGLRNLQVCIKDAAELDGSFDIVLLSLFGGLEIQRYLELCRKKLIMIVGSGRKSGLYPERYRREIKNAVPDVKKALEAMDVRFTLESYAHEFGQPLRTMGEAELFILSNAPEAGHDEVDEFLNANIRTTDSNEFPYYLPYLKELGIFVIDK